MDMLQTKLIRTLAPVLLLLILILAAGLRFINLNWDNGIFAHPDERSSVAFYAPTIRWPDDPETLLDPRASTLNPFWDVQNQSRRSYTYGHFPLYVLVLAAHGLKALTPLAAGWGLPADWVWFLDASTSGQGYALVGRALVALADLFTVYLVFLLGWRLYGLWAGLLAAALSALTVLQIQLAHFFAVDPISTTFTLLALYGAVLMVHRQSRGAAVLTGVGIGLAVASKFSALPVAFAPIAAGYLAVTRSRAAEDGPGRGLAGRMLGLAVVALVVSFVVFIVTSPFVFLDFENFRIAVLEEQGNMVSGMADFPFTRQYRNTIAYWYFIEQQVRWGMGWPLGLLAMAGTAWVFGKAVTGRARPGEWILLGWVVLYFGPTGLFLAKFMRYMIPVVPLLVLFGAGLVAALWQFGNRLATGEPHWPFFRRLARPVAGLVALVALAGAAVWSLAFANGVYRTEHPWVTFARWTYATVPDGACIAREHWDEGIPAAIPEPRGTPYEHGYFQPELPMYEEDTWQKYENLRATLMNCDYIALASNRLWRTIPHLPERYPMSSRYYEALFSGELGFEQVFSVETPPRLGPLVFDDQAADESFTVYDHPRPMMFKKVRQLSEAEWETILGGTWQEAIPGYIGRPTLLMRLRGYNNLPGYASRPAQAEAGSKSLLLDRPVDQLPVVDDFRWNNAANNSGPVAILFWWLVTMAIGLLAWPLTFLLFYRLVDRGYALSKSLGLLLVSYFVWINSSLGGLGNRLSTALMALVLLAGLALWAAVKFRQELLAFWRQRGRLILVTEAVFGLVYMFFVYLRLLNPDLWQPWLGGEKMLEIGFLNAIVRSAEMPPYDPFFAGGIINYYYYGLFIVGILIKLTGIEPAIAFNLAVPTLAALTAANIFSLAGNLAGARLRLAPRPRRGPTPPPSAPGALKFSAAGLLATLFVLFIGNLEGAAQFLRELGNASTISFQSAIPGLETLVRAVAGFGQALAGNASLATYNYWDPTRVIPATINEFPYFSFLFADLHPHMIGIPFTILLLSLAYNWLAGEPVLRRPAGPPEEPVLEAQDGFVEMPDAQPEPVEPAAAPLQEPVIEQPAETGPGFGRNYYAAFSPWQSVFSLAQLLRWLALPFVLGALAVINTWDLPTYLGLMVAAFVLGRYRQIRGLLGLRQAGLLAASGAVFAGLLLGLTYLLYLPFFANYQALDVGLGLVHTQTALDQHLKIWGLFLFIIVSWLVLSLFYPASRSSLLRATSLVLRRLNVAPHLVEIYRKLVKRQSDLYQLSGWGIGVVLLAAVILALLGYHVPAYLLPLVALALLLLVRREVEGETAYLNLLAFTGLLVLLGVEFFFLRDFLGGGEHFRMNTLFKFFIQVWVLFSLVSALTLPRLWEWSGNWAWPGQLLWRSAAALLLMAGLVYPVFATRTRVDDRFPGQDNRPPFGTLDGLAYMTTGEFEWPAGSPVELKYDYEAIRWLQENVTGTPVLAEAKVGFYREGGMRVAAYTGLPSILGGLHQNEQRYASQVGQRDMLVNEFWSTPDPARTMQLVHELDISYIYLGQIERITHGYYIEDKFEQIRAQGSLEVVFRNEKTTIYKVVE